MPPKQESNFMTDWPSWVRVLTQLGFAGVIALLFVLDSRDRSSQLREMQAETRQQGRDDREMFRTELRLQREELKEAVLEMRRAIMALSDQQKKLKSDIDDVKNPFPPIPAPHFKPQE